MTTDIHEILNTLGLKTEGSYVNHFYIINLKDSNEYAKMYTLLDKNAINTEFPDYETNSSGNTIKVTNYFELEINEVNYNIFLIANFKDEAYLIKIGEK